LGIPATWTLLHDERDAVQGAPGLAGREVGVGLSRRRQRTVAIEGDEGVEVAGGLGPRQVRLRQLQAGHRAVADEPGGLGHPDLGEIGRARGGAGTAGGGQQQRHGDRGGITKRHRCLLSSVR
jgi:hypothetical protein